MVKIETILAALKKKRPIFHSEADFQHALAWEIHRQLPKASIRLEMPVQVKNRTIHVDIYISHQNETMAVELKYKTRALSIDIGSEKYRLKSQSAQDTGRYDFLKDIYRLEQVGKQYDDFAGVAVLLTNDSAYWTKPTHYETYDASFRLHDGRVVGGRLAWSDKASDGTKRGREQPIELAGKYLLRWTDYSQPSTGSHGKFRSLIVRVVESDK